MSRKDNFERLLPFPRCIVSFRVRRQDKKRECVSISDFIRILELRDADKSTFLYIRNGDQLYRMETAIAFGEKLFPDTDREQLTGKLWARMFADRVEKIISDNEHAGIVEEQDRKKREWEKRNAVYQAALKSPLAKKRARKRGLKEPDASCVDVPWPGHGWFDDFDNYVPYDRSTVYYDDITEKLDDEIRKHNQIALVIQGLLDRSPALHPHPPWLQLRLLIQTITRPRTKTSDKSTCADSGGEAVGTIGWPVGCSILLLPRSGR